MYCLKKKLLLFYFRLFVLLRRFPIESKGRQKKLYEVIATLQQLPLLSNFPSAG
jgi:hypothetical protein